MELIQRRDVYDKLINPGDLVVTYTGLNRDIRSLVIFAGYAEEYGDVYFYIHSNKKFHWPSNQWNKHSVRVDNNIRPCDVLRLATDIIRGNRNLPDRLPEKDND